MHVHNRLRHPDDQEPWPIGANTGGPVDPHDHIGHNAQLEEVFEATTERDRVGALVTGDRRMGKTSLTRITQRLLEREGFEVVQVSAETSDPALFGRRLAEALKKKSFMRDEFERWSLEVDVSYKGIGLTRQSDTDGAAQETSDDLFAYAARKSPARLIFIIDEITVLLQAFAGQSPDAALEFLRSLRRVRQNEQLDVAMILSGSVGLHHVVPDLEGVNDLAKVRVDRLEPEDARFLAACLMLGEGVEAVDHIAVAAASAQASGGVAYYLHHIVNALGRQTAPATPQAVRQIVTDLIEDPDDPADFRHYRQRLPTYYGDDAELAGLLLDGYSSTSEGLTVDDAMRIVSAQSHSALPSRNDFVLLIEKLAHDSYLRRDGDVDRFSTSILAAAWASMRRL